MQYLNGNDKYGHFYEKIWTLKSTGENVAPNMLDNISLNKDYLENNNIIVLLDALTNGYLVSRKIVKTHNG